MVQLSEVPAYAGLEVLKNVVRIYDAITFPLYFIVQKPWIKKTKYNRIRAVQEDPSNPYSAWVRVGTPPEMIIDKCTTIDEIMKKCIQVYRDRNCMGYRKVLEEIEELQADGKVHLKKRLAPEYTFLTFGQVDERIDDIMRGLLLSGVQPGDKMVIFMETRMEWMLTAQALYRLGGCVATVYATLGEEGVIHVINEVGSSHLLTSADLLPKLKNIASKLPNLKHVIYLEDHIKYRSKADHGYENTGIQLIRFEEMEAEGKNASKDLVGRPPKTSDVALIMYTSGSTGVPKGVMHWHSNYVAALQSLYTVFPDLKVQKGDLDVGFLPLAHNLEFTKEHLEFVMGMAVAYASPLTLTDASPGLAPGTRGDIMLIRPSALIAVPLILDRIRKTVTDKIERKGKFMQLLFEYIIDYKNYWVGRGFNTPIINYFVSRKVREGLGGSMRGIFCGGAPLAPVTQRFARACLDVVVMQGYGATETTAVATLMDLFDWSEGRTGAPVFGSKVRLVDWEEGGYRVTDKPRPRGEVVVGGPSITAGYHKQPEVTAEAFRFENGERWFYTGDIGEFYPDGTLKIIDRKKDLLKLACGEYVSLGKVSLSNKMELRSVSRGRSGPLSTLQ